MSAREGVAAVVLLRTTRSRTDMTHAFGAEGIARVERIRGPYDFVIHAASRAQVDVIQRLPGVTTAEVCWLSSSREGGNG